jgi:hypothetical protein
VRRQSFMGWRILDAIKPARVSLPKKRFVSPG